MNRRNSWSFLSRNPHLFTQGKRMSYYYVLCIREEDNLCHMAIAEIDQPLDADQAEEYHREQCPTAVKLQAVELTKEELDKLLDEEQDCVDDDNWDFPQFLQEYFQTRYLTSRMQGKELSFPFAEEEKEKMWARNMYMKHRATWGIPQ